MGTALVVQVLYKDRVNTSVSLVAAAYHKNEEGEIELRIFNSSDVPVEIQPNQVLGFFDSLNQEPLQMHRPREKWDEDDLTTIGKAAVPLGTRKNLDDILEEIDIGSVPTDIKDQLIKIIQKTNRDFSLSPEDIGCFTGFEVTLKLKD